MNRQDLRIQFYGSEDARVYDSDELHLMEEYANLRLSEQKEKHEQEMEEFNLFVSANFMYSFEEKKWYHNNFAQHNSVHYEKHYTFTELLTKFKNR